MLQRTRASVSLSHRAAAFALAGVLALAGLVAAAPASSAAETRTITGSFTVPATGIESWWDETVFISAQGVDNGVYKSATVNAASKTFSITGLEPGAYRLDFATSWVDHDGDGYSESSNLIGGAYPGGVINVTSGDATGVTFSYSAGSAVSGTVTLGAGADPAWADVLEASVSIPGPDGCQCGDSITTKVNPTTGAYVIRGLPAKQLTVQFGPAWNSNANLIPEYYNNSYTWEGATQLDFAAGSYTNINATLEVGKTIGGTVTLPGGVSTDALKGVDVEVHGSQGQYRQADVDPTTGAYTVYGLMPDTFSVKFRASNWSDASYNTVYTPLASVYYGGASTEGASTKVNVSTSNATGRDQTMVVGKTISGTVTLAAGIDAKWKQALYVYAESADGVYRSAKADPVSGAYTMMGLSPGDYVVSFDAAALNEGGEWIYDDFAFEYYNNKRSPLAANIVTIATSNATGINATMDAQVGNRNFWTTPQPTITGTAAPGNTLTANPGTWEPYNNDFTYQWLRDGVAVGGATAKTFAVTQADAGRSLTVSVTSTRAGYNQVTQTSAAKAVPATAFASAPSPTISGTFTVGQTLTAAAGAWNPAPALAYQWTRNGSPIAGATSSTYALVAADASATVGVTVTGTLAGYTTTTRSAAGSSVASAQFSASPTPTIAGTFTVGQTLTATAGAWSPAPTLAYQWTRNGSPIAGATSSTYALVPADAGATVAVTVTGTLAGYATTSRSATGSTVGAAAFTAAPTPTISGTAEAGRTLTAVPGAWSPSATFAYQWLRDGSPIPGATASTYAVTQDDAVKSLSVTVTGSATGYITTSKTSATVAVAATPFTTAPTPTIAGTAVYGNTLTANAGSWSPSATLSYQWLRNGSPIGGATASTYALTPADVDAALSVRVIGSATGYANTAKTSAAVAVAAATFVEAPPVGIVGAVEIGNTVTASDLPWSPAATFTYQWYRNGEAISGATSSAYTLVEADGGQFITVTVTGSAPGYAPITRVSGAKTPTGHFFSATPAPTVTGTFKTGSTLTATINQWTPAADFGREWLRDGEPIDGANSLTYKLTASDVGHAISFRVIGHLDGYERHEATSVPTTVTAGTFATVPTPTISGSAYPGATLTANVGTWVPAASGLAYQWKRNGVAISGATAKTYKLTSADSAKKITVTVTGSAAGYTSAAKTSASLTLAKFFTKTGTASITGTVKVGSTVKASVGTWSPAPTSYSYKWLRNGVAISGATSSSYKVTTADAGKKLTVTVTGKRSGYASTPKTSAAKTVAYGTFSAAPTPKITGTVKVGYTLTLSRGTWSPAPSSYTYQWYRSGTAISGATASKYKLVSSDRGKTITVKVTAKKSGYTTTSRTSAKTVAVK